MAGIACAAVAALLLSGCGQHLIELDPDNPASATGAGVTTPTVGTKSDTPPESEASDPSHPASTGDGAAPDCARVHVYQLVAICGENEALCAACGPCLSCDALGGDAVCDLRPPSLSGGHLERRTDVLVCTRAGCFERQPCEIGARCLMGGPAHEPAHCEPAR